MDRPLFEFARLLRRESQSLSQADLLVFSLACCERQFPVYCRAALGNAWDQSEVLRHALDYAWGVIRVDPGMKFNQLLVEKCIDAAPNDPEVAQDLAAAEIAYSISNVISFGLAGDVEYVMAVSETSFNSIDALIYSNSGLEVNSVGDVDVDTHEIMQEEIRCQKNDLSDIIRAGDFFDKSRLLYGRNVGKSMFNEMWYPDEYC